MYPRMVELRLGRAQCYEELGRTEEALADIEAAVRYAPKDAEARYARGRIRPESEHAQAIEDFTASIALDDENAEVWAARAHAHHMQGQLDRAIEDATRALALDPDNVTALFTRAFAHHRRGDYDAARAGYDDLVRAAPDEPEYAEARARAIEHIERVTRGEKA
jgi:tetratricopeptide (TPR) repeat protein